MMTSLPPALQALAAYPQFINWRPAPRGDGKVDKLPVNPHNGQVCNAHDRAAHVTAEQAFATGMRVAFVFTDKDPFFFIDIDNAMTVEGWSDAATQMCATFAGCGVEVSQSNNGIHIFGVIPPGNWPHGCDSKTLGTQFYTSGRFVALTGVNTIGDAGYSPDAVVYGNWISDYFPAGPVISGVPENWTTEPVPEWAGPEDDKTLISRMLKAKSARGILGGTATLKQLWEADEVALSKTFPDTIGDQGRAFDWSVADSALCSHLAFWTGKNCERMDKIFRQSALSRDKWVERDTYRETTILRSVANCSNVYKQRGAVTEGSAPMGFQFCTLQDQLKLFHGCSYVRDVHRVFVPDTGELLRPEQFRATFGGHVFTLDAMGDKTTRNAWEVFTESQAYQFPRVHTTRFRPELMPGEIEEYEGVRSINTYIPIVTKRTAGDPAPFLGLINKMLPESHDRNILFAYLAACVQYPGIKFQWAPLLQGVEGNGKSFIGACLTHAIGEKYTHSLDQKDIGNIFNSWVYRKLLVIVEEVHTRGRMDAIKTLGWLIANRRIPMQAKGQDQITGDNRANFLMFTNPKDAIQKTRRDRKFCIFYTAQQEPEDLIAAGMGGTYFPELFNWGRAEGFAIVNEYLHTYKIPEEFNPAKNCHRAPDTTSTPAVLINSLGIIEQDIIDAVESHKTGFTDGWISSLAFNAMLKEMHMKLPVNRRREMLKDIGYVPHPALTKGRVNNNIAVEQGKPVLYVKVRHPAYSITDAAMVSRVYQEAQGYIVPKDTTTTRRTA